MKFKLKYLAIFGISILLIGIMFVTSSKTTLSDLGLISLESASAFGTTSENLSIEDKHIGQLKTSADNLNVTWTHLESESNFYKQVFELEVKQTSAGTSQRTVSDAYLYINELNYNISEIKLSDLNISKRIEQWTNEYYPKTCNQTTYETCAKIVNGTNTSWNYPSCTAEGAWATVTKEVTDASICGQGVNYVISTSYQDMPVSESMLLSKYGVYPDGKKTTDTGIIDLPDMIIPAYSSTDVTKRVVLRVELKVKPEKLETGGIKSTGVFSVKLGNNEFWDKTHSSWWNNTFLYKQELSNLTTNISYLNISYNANMQADFDDLRFLDSATESILLNYTIESKSDSNWVIVRVNNLGATAIYMYYGNSGVSTTSNVSNVHLLPLNYYYFDGNANDALGVNNGSVSGATVNSSGHISSAYTFDGINDYINRSSFSSSTQSYTFSFWANPSLQTTNFVFDCQTSRLVIATASSDISSNIGYFDGSWRSFAVKATVGTWKHYAFVFNSSNSKGTLYINGVKQATEPDYSPVSIGGTNKIGINYDGSGGAYGGSLDEFAIYDRALTATQVYALYNYSAPNYVGGTIESNLPCTFKGYIKYTNGTGVNGAPVIITREKDNIATNTTTDANGYWEKNITKDNLYYSVASRYNSSGSLYIGYNKAYLNNTC